ncbi:hypothetical protein K1719_047514, partial [Acacia pycnantha]
LYPPSYWFHLSVILALHGQKGIPGTARVALIDTIYKSYQNALIGVLLTTLSNGSLIMTIAPDFNIKLFDRTASQWLKVHIHITGADQDPEAMMATLYYQMMVYRLFTLGARFDVTNMACSRAWRQPAAEPRPKNGASTWLLALPVLNMGPDQLQLRRVGSWPVPGLWDTSKHTCRICPNQYINLDYFDISLVDGWSLVQHRAEVIKVQISRTASTLVLMIPLTGSFFLLLNKTGCSLHQHCDYWSVLELSLPFLCPQPLSYLAPRILSETTTCWLPTFPSALFYLASWLLLSIVNKKVEMENAWAWNAIEALSSFEVPFVSLAHSWLSFCMQGLASSIHRNSKDNQIHANPHENIDQQAHSEVSNILGEGSISGCDLDVEATELEHVNVIGAQAGSDNKAEGGERMEEIGRDALHIIAGDGENGRRGMNVKEKRNSGRGRGRS